MLGGGVIVGLIFLPVFIMAAWPTMLWAGLAGVVWNRARAVEKQAKKEGRHGLLAGIIAGQTLPLLLALAIVCALQFLFSAMCPPDEVISGVERWLLNVRDTLPHWTRLSFPQLCLVVAVVLLMSRILRAAEAIPRLKEVLKAAALLNKTVAALAAFTFFGHQAVEDTAKATRTHIIASLRDKEQKREDAARQVQRAANEDALRAQVLRQTLAQLPAPAQARLRGLFEGIFGMDEKHPRSAWERQRAQPSAQPPATAVESDPLSILSIVSKNVEDALRVGLSKNVEDAFWARLHSPAPEEDVTRLLPKEIRDEMAAGRLVLAAQQADDARERADAIPQAISRALEEAGNADAKAAGLDEMAPPAERPAAEPSDAAWAGKTDAGLLAEWDQKQTEKEPPPAPAPSEFDEACRLLIGKLFDLPVDAALEAGRTYFEQFLSFLPALATKHGLDMGEKALSKWTGQKLEPLVDESVRRLSSVIARGRTEEEGLGDATRCCVAVAKAEATKATRATRRDVVANYGEHRADMAKRAAAIAEVCAARAEVLSGELDPMGASAHLAGDATATAAAAAREAATAARAAAKEARTASEAIKKAAVREAQERKLYGEGRPGIEGHPVFEPHVEFHPMPHFVPHP